MKFEFRNVRGHIEVYCGNVFLFSADTIAEAEQELFKEDSAGE